MYSRIYKIFKTIHSYRIDFQGFVEFVVDGACSIITFLSYICDKKRNKILVGTQEATYLSQNIKSTPI